MSEVYVSILSDEPEPRTSTLVIETSGWLRVMGNLPHGYRFKPKTERDARLLRDYFDARLAESNEEKAAKALRDMGLLTKDKGK